MRDAAAIDPDLPRALREAFDRSFAAPRAAPAARGVDFLAIRAGRSACAVRLKSLKSVVKGVAVSPLPTRREALLGVASVGGGVVPVYALAALLDGGPVAHPPSFALVTAGACPVALAFDSLDGIFSVAPRDIRPSAQKGRAPRYVLEVAETEVGARPVVDVARVEQELLLRRGPSGAERQE